MPSIDDLERVTANTARLVRGVRTEQWAAPTPCVEWDVAALVNHTTGVVEMFGAAVQGRRPATPRDERALAAEPAADFDQAAATTVAAWRARGLEGTVEIRVGEIPAPVALGINICDAYLHGWDLAQATGQDARLDDALSAELLTFITQFLPPEPRDQNFGPVVDVASDASPADRLIAYSGRKP